MPSRRLVKLLDLVNDQALIRAYERHHAADQLWPDVGAYIRAQGISDMQIWRFRDRLVMIVEVEADYPRPIPEPKINRDWEMLMDRFQRRLSLDGDDKWVDAAQIFSLGGQ